MKMVNNKACVKNSGLSLISRKILSKKKINFTGNRYIITNLLNVSFCRFKMIMEILYYSMIYVEGAYTYIYIFEINLPLVKD